MAGTNSVQTVGNLTLSFIHPLIGAGVNITLQGFKLEEEFLTSVQMMDNAKRVALVGGGTAALTNSVKAGDLTLNCVRIGTDVLSGDVPLIATTLLALADSQGGIIRASYGFNGSNEALTFLGVIVKSCPPLKIAGNDLPTYPVVFSYADYVRA